VTGVPEQDKPENQDPSVQYMVDRWGRKTDLDGNVLDDDPGDVGFGSGAAASIDEAARVQREAEEQAEAQKKAESGDTATPEATPKRAARKSAASTSES
jgi:hypothetical protein